MVEETMAEFLKNSEEKYGMTWDLSENFKKDLEYRSSRSGHNVMMNSRDISFRVIYHIFNLKSLVLDVHNMNYEVGEGCIKSIAKLAGVELNLDEMLDIVGKLLPIINKNINDILKAMGYMEGDRKFLEDYFGVDC